MGWNDSTSGSWKGPVWTWTCVHGTHYLWLLVECCLDMVLTTSGSWRSPVWTRTHAHGSW